MSLAPPDTEPGLPPFAPPTELVEATAAAMVGEEWAALDGLTKFHVRSSAFKTLTAVGDQLLAASLDHVTTHAAAFGFNEDLANELMFARMAGAFAALPTTGDDTVAEGPADQT